MFLFKTLLFCIFLWYVSAAPQHNNDQDTEITRVQTLRQEERNLATPNEKTRSIYLVNILPVPPNRRGDSENNDNDLKQNIVPKDPRGRVPALFFLQKVKDDGRLPDGIYYRPPADETETPPPVFQKDISNLHAFALAPGASRPRNIN